MPKGKLEGKIEKDREWSELYDNHVVVFSLPADWEKSGVYEELPQFIEILNSINIKCDIQDIKEDSRKLLVINWNNMDILKKTNRGAGANKKILNDLYTVAEIRERMKTESADIIAKELGIGRATLFRRLKKAEKEGFKYL